MSHFVALCITQDPSEVEQLLLPYQEPDNWDETNDLGKWDWWVIGGRWPGELARHDGTQCDQARLSEIDRASVRPGWALVTAEGWTEKGEMGWFGQGTDTPESTEAYNQRVREFLATAPDDWWLTVVDCHV